MTERQNMRATSQVQIENEWVKVTEWCFAPGAETGHHVHAYDYVVVPLTSGVLRLEDRAGQKDAQLTSGLAYARAKGVEHNVINANAFEFRFLEIEMLQQRVAVR
jgi:quercetin dioxygenase-like cupin family protein